MGKTKRVADGNASEPPVIIPIVVVLVAIHLALAIPLVERDESCKVPSLPPPVEYSPGCIVCRIIIR